MDADATTIVPRARAEGLVVEELGDEVLIYDLDRDEAHCLNSTAAAVWRRCDGARTVGALAADLSDEPGAPVGEEVVWRALDVLARNELLIDASPVQERLSEWSRRELLARAGMAGAAVGVGLPMVKSIVAPTAVQAQTVTCVPAGCPGCPGLPCCPDSCTDAQKAAGGSVSCCADTPDSRCGCGFGFGCIAPAEPAECPA